MLAILWDYNFNNDIHTACRFFMLPIALLVIYQCAILIRMRTKIYEFRMIFMLFQYLFVFGLVFAYSLNFDRHLAYQAFTHCSVLEAARGISYALCCIQGLFTGLVWEETESIGMDLLRVQSSKRTFIVGLVGFIMFLPFKLYYDSFYISIASANSRYIGSDSVQINGMVFCFSNVALIFVLYILASKYLSIKKIILLLLPIYLYLFYVMGKTGDRRSSVIFVLVTCLCFIKTYDIKMRPIRTILAMAMAYFLLNFIMIISATRRSGLPDFFEMLSLLKEGMQSNTVILSVLAEFGVTIMTFVFPLAVYPKLVNYKFGISFLSDLLAIFPLGPYLGDFFSESNVTVDIYKYTKQPVGGSIGAELYGNFGMFSLIIIIVTGVILNRLISVRKGTKHFTGWDSARYFSTMFILMNLVRTGFDEITRLYFYGILIPWFLLKIISVKKMADNKTIRLRGREIRGCIGNDLEFNGK